MEKVTEQMREAARDYLRRRLDNERSWSDNLGRWLDEAIGGICAVVVKYGITARQLMDGSIPERARREIDVIISDLAAEIAEAVLTLAQDEREDSEWFVAFLKREFEDGWNFDDRLLTYTERFGDQVLMAVAALSLLGVASTAWADSIEGNKRDLYNSPFVSAVRSERMSYFSPMGMGRGVPHNMSVAIDNLGRAEIANAWMEWEYEEAKANKAIGYYVFRGSSYPCPECDSHVGWHEMDDYYGKPGYHPNCYCYSVYVYE